MVRYFYQIDGINHGPVGANDLKQLAHAGKLRAFDLIRPEERLDWTLASNVKGLVFPEISLKANDSALCTPAGELESKPRPKRPITREIVILSCAILTVLAAVLLIKNISIQRSPLEAQNTDDHLPMLKEQSKAFADKFELTAKNDHTLTAEYHIDKNAWLDNHVYYETQQIDLKKTSSFLHPLVGTITGLVTFYKSSKTSYNSSETTGAGAQYDITKGTLTTEWEWDSNLSRWKFIDYHFDGTRTQTHIGHEPAEQSSKVSTVDKLDYLVKNSLPEPEHIATE